MPEMPTLGSAPKKSPVAGVAVAAVIAGALAGGAYWWTHRDAPTTPVTPPPPTAAAPENAANPATGTQAAAPAPATPTTPTTPGATPTAAAAPANPTAAAAAAGLKSFTTTISGPLESAVIAKAGKETGAPLTQVITRSLVWWLRVPQDLVKGDTLAVVYEERKNQEPMVHAVRLTSQKLGKTVEAYRYQQTGDPFSRFFQPDGSELEERLVDGPLDTYEQVSSLLKDGRHHKGVDFKTPLGTPVHATFEGVVTRKNWNFRGNGNCLELEEVGGQHRSALFLHLSEVAKLQQAFEAAIGARRAADAAEAVLNLDRSILEWSADTLQTDEPDRARAVLHSLVHRLGEAAAEGLRDPRDLLGPLVESLIALRAELRTAKQWELADRVRDRLIAANIELRDTSTGTVWELRARVGVSAGGDPAYPRKLDSRNL